MGNYRPFLQGPLPVANYTRIIIPGRFWTRPPSTKSTRMASSATPLHDSLIELAIPDAHAHAIKWYLNRLTCKPREVESIYIFFQWHLRLHDKYPLDKWQCEENHPWRDITNRQVASISIDYTSMHSTQTKLMMAYTLMRFIIET